MEASNAAYIEMTPERRASVDRLILELEQRIQEHKRNKDRRKDVLPVAVERRVADRRG